MAPPGVIAHITDRTPRRDPTDDHNRRRLAACTTARGCRPRRGTTKATSSRTSTRACSRPPGPTPAFDDRGWEHAQVVGPHPDEPWTAPRRRSARTIVEQRVEARDVSRRLANGDYVADFGSVIAATPAITLRHGQAGPRRARCSGFRARPDGQRLDDARHAGDRHARRLHRARRRADAAPVRLSRVPLPRADRHPHETLTAARRDRRTPATPRCPTIGRELVLVVVAILDAIWELARHSALYGSQEQFVDTPTREKGQFVGTRRTSRASPRSRSASASSRGRRCATSPARRRKFWPDGRVNAVYPNSDGGRDIPDFTEDYVGWVLAATTRRRAIAPRSPRSIPTSRNSPTTSPAPIEPQPVSSRTCRAAAATTRAASSTGRSRCATATTSRSPALTTVNILADRRLPRRRRGGAGAAPPGIRGEGPASTRRPAHERGQRPIAPFRRCLHRRAPRRRHAEHPRVAAGERVRARGGHRAGDAIAPPSCTRSSSLGMAHGSRHRGCAARRAARVGKRSGARRPRQQREDPGLGADPRPGATFTWESWNARDVPGDSESHAWGSTVLPALIDRVLGVRVAAPGASRVDVRTAAQDDRESRRGPARDRTRRRSRWRGIAPTRGTSRSSSPFPTTSSRACISRPSSPAYVREGGHALGSVNGVKVDSVGSGTVRLAVGSGRYTFARGTSRARPTAPG